MGNGCRTAQTAQTPDKAQDTAAVQQRFAPGAQYIGGRLRSGTSSRSHTVTDPATGREVLTYELAGTADVDAAVAAARDAFPAWAGATPPSAPTPCTGSPPSSPSRPRTSPAPSPSSAASPSG